MKKQLQMVTRLGVYPASPPSGSAPDVAPVSHIGVPPLGDSSLPEVSYAIASRSSVLVGCRK